MHTQFNLLPLHRDLDKYKYDGEIKYLYLIDLIANDIRNIIDGAKFRELCIGIMKSDTEKTYKEFAKQLSNRFKQVPVNKHWEKAKDLEKYALKDGEV